MEWYEWFLALSTVMMWFFPIWQLLVAIFGRKSGPIVPLPEGVLPNPPTRMFLLVPALNEDRVIGSTVERLLSLDCPGTEVNVLVIDDGSDDDTGHILDQVVNPRFHVLHRVLPEARLGKGAALNNAYALIVDMCAKQGWDQSTVVLGIIDADGRPSPNLLSKVRELFEDPGVVAVQSRVQIRNTKSFWGMVQELEFFESVNAAQNVRDRIGAVALGGNGQFTRLSALEALGGAPWTDCLVEDLDLGLRLHLAGGEIRYTPDAYISQQGLEDTRRLLRQRARWTQGNIQCLSFIPDVMRAQNINRSARLEMFWYLALSVIGILGALAIVIGLAVMIEAPTVWDAPDLILWLIALFSPGFIWAFVYMKQNPDTSWWMFIKLSVGYVALVFVSAASVWRAWYRHVKGKRGWVKTERVVEAGSEGELDEGSTTGTVEETTDI